MTRAAVLTLYGVGNGDDLVRHRTGRSGADSFPAPLIRHGFVGILSSSTATLRMARKRGYALAGWVPFEWCLEMPKASHPLWPDEDADNKGDQITSGWMTHGLTNVALLPSKLSPGPCRSAGMARSGT
jgi:hypothetical protein